MQFDQDSVPMPPAPLCEWQGDSLESDGGGTFLTGDGIACDTGLWEMNFTTDNGSATYQRTAGGAGTCPVDDVSGTETFIKVASNCGAGPDTWPSTITVYE